MKGSAGFSLTEVLVGGAVLAGVGLAGAQLFRTQKKAQKNVEHEQELALFHGHLQKLMENNANCNATMKSVIPANTPIAANQPVINLRTCATGCTDTNATMNQNVLANRAWDAYTVGAYVPSGTALLTSTAPNNWVGNTKIWEVTQMVMVDAQTVTGPNKLRISYRLNKDAVGQVNNAKTINKDIFLNLRFFGGGFKECINRQENSVANTQSDLCKSLNLQGSGVTTDGRIAQWDESTQTCNINTSKTCDYYNMTADGMGADGTIRCKPIVDTGDTNRLEDASAPPVTCGGGQQPMVVWRNKKMTVICVNPP